MGRYYIDADDFGFFPSSARFMERPARPYIAIVMDLDVQRSHPKYAQLSENTILQADVPMAEEATISHHPKTQFSAIEGKHSVADAVHPHIVPTKYDMPVKSTPKNNHPRYAIVATGCSHMVYAVIPWAHRKKWQSLRRQDDLLGDHPRPRTGLSVRNMKPSWSFGPECYSWYKSQLLNEHSREPESDQEDEGSLYVLTHEGTVKEADDRSE